jgi:hypothetical protein
MGQEHVCRVSRHHDSCTSKRNTLLGRKLTVGCTLGETFGPQLDVYWLIYGNALAMTGLKAKAATSFCTSRKRIETQGIGRAAVLTCRKSHVGPPKSHAAVEGTHECNSGWNWRTPHCPPVVHLIGPQDHMASWELGNFGPAFSAVSCTTKVEVWRAGC